MFRLEVGALGDEHHPFFAHAHVEPLFGDDALQDPPVWAVGAVLENGLLAGQRGGVNQERDGYLVTPCLGPIVEDVVEPGLPSEQIFKHLPAGLAPHVGGDHVQQVAVADLVLGLGQDGHFVAQPRGAWNPVAFGEAAHQLGVGVQLDEGEHGPAVVVGHVVIHLDDATLLYERLKFLHGGPRAAHRSTPASGAPSGAPFTPGRLATMVRTS